MEIKISMDKFLQIVNAGLNKGMLDVEIQGEVTSISIQQDWGNQQKVVLDVGPSRNGW